MKTLNKIIISAVLFLGLQSHSFATDEQENMGLAQQAKPGFSQLLIHFKTQACDEEETEDAPDEGCIHVNNDHAASMEGDGGDSFLGYPQDYNNVQGSLTDMSIVPDEDCVEDENNIKTISSSRKRKRLKFLLRENQAGEGPSAKKINKEPAFIFEQDSEGFSILPAEIQVYIFSFLDQKEFHRASLVRQSWRDVARMSEGKRRLDLSKRKLNVEDCQILLQIPFSLMILRNCQLTDQEALTLSCSMRIKKLDLSRNNLRAGGAQALAKGDLTALTSLNLRRNSIGVKGVEYLTMGNLKALTFLNLRDNGIGDEGVKQFANGALTTLTSLNLGENGIHALGALNLASGNLTTLTFLDLRDNALGDEGALNLSKGHFFALKSLDLAGNDIRDRGVESLANGNLTALTFLNLTENEIGDEGAESLANGNLTTLKSLNLGENEIGDEGALALGALTTLECLRLFSNNISDTGAKGIASGNLTALTSLDLRYNNIGEEGKAALKKMSTLKELEF